MSLKKIRQEIDIIDDKIIPLLEERLILACKTRKYKKEHLDKTREEEILKKISSPYIKDIYRCIFNSFRKKKLTHLWRFSSMKNNKFI